MAIRENVRSSNTKQLQGINIYSQEGDSLESRSTARKNTSRAIAEENSSFGRQSDAIQEINTAQDRLSQAERQNADSLKQEIEKTILQSYSTYRDRFNKIYRLGLIFVEAKKAEMKNPKDLMHYERYTKEHKILKDSGDPIITGILKSDNVIKENLKEATQKAEIYKEINWVDSITANILNKVKLTQIITYIFILLAVLLWVVMIVFIMYLAIFTIILKFSCAMILAICPLMIPCLVIQPLRQYFYSWLKLYASTALQVPFVYLIGGAILMGGAMTTEIQMNSETTFAQDLSNCLSPIVFVIIGVALLQHVPAWCQAIVGSASGEHKTGVAGAVAGAGSMALQGAQTYSQARNDMNYKTGGRNGILRSAAAGVAGMFGLSGTAQRIAGQTAGDKARWSEGIKSGDGRMSARPTPHSDKGASKAKWGKKK